MNIIREKINTIHPMITGGLIVRYASAYYRHRFFWYFNNLEEKPLSLKEYLKKHFMGIAFIGVNGFVIGSTLGSFALLAKQGGPTRNIIATLLSIGFCVGMRQIDIML